MSISLEDFRAMYHNSLVMYKGKPVVVLSIADNTFNKESKYALLLLDVEKQVHVNILANDDRDFSNLNRRLGYVNCMGTCAYVTRIPVRRYKVGLANENIRVHVLDTKHTIHRDHVRAAITELSFKGLADTLFNRYPSFANAVHSVTVGLDSAVAFDRQFAIDRSLVIYYKNEAVGAFPKNARQDVNSIQWETDKEYLIQLLDGNYEKTIRNIKVF